MIVDLGMEEPNISPTILSDKEDDKALEGSLSSKKQQGRVEYYPKITQCLVTLYPYAS